MVVWSPSFSSLVAVAAAAGVVDGDGTGETDVGGGVAAIVGEDVGYETIAGFVVVAVDGPMAAFVFDGAAKVAGDLFPLLPGRKLRELPLLLSPVLSQLCHRDFCGILAGADENKINQQTDCRVNVQPLTGCILFPPPVHVPAYFFIIIRSGASTRRGNRPYKQSGFISKAP